VARALADLRLPWRVPVMQAPIGPAATPALAAAVSEAGGIGSLGASWTVPEALRSQLREIRGLTERPVCVNLVLAFEQEERLEVALAEGVEVISFSWGTDARLAARARAAGAVVAVQAGSSAEARAAVEAGCDVVVAQGVEAGGHVQGEIGVLALVGELSRTLAVPVLAAGGIADARGVRAAMAAGAAGAMIGTRFLATPEADVHPDWAARLLSASAADTVLTDLFDGGWPGAPHRVLRNSTFRRWDEAGRPAFGARPGEGEVVARHGGQEIRRYAADEPRRDTAGDLEAMCLYAGQGVGLVTEVEPAAEVIGRIAAELSGPR
jgi:NAD(P)H-dependent flavin oxidoreductase YrpB (nitropropane dioxygenase family)